MMIETKSYYVMIKAIAAYTMKHVVSMEAYSLTLPVQPVYQRQG